jgi:chemotaxis methyl-accepting protein methylase
MINFKRHDLLRDQLAATLDLILCRNVVIYFTEENQD